MFEGQAEFSIHCTSLHATHTGLRVHSDQSQNAVGLHRASTAPAPSRCATCGCCSPQTSRGGSRTCPPTHRKNGRCDNSRATLRCKATPPWLAGEKRCGCRTLRASSWRGGPQTHRTHTGPKRRLLGRHPVQSDASLVGRERLVRRELALGEVVRGRGARAVPGVDGGCEVPERAERAKGGAAVVVPLRGWPSARRTRLPKRVGVDSLLHAVEGQRRGAGGYLRAATKRGCKRAL